MPDPTSPPEPDPAEQPDPHSEPTTHTVEDVKANAPLQTYRDDD